MRNVEPLHRDGAVVQLRQRIVLRQLLDAVTDYVRAKAPKIYSRELVDLIFEKVQPYRDRV